MFHKKSYTVPHSYIVNWTLNFFLFFHKSKNNKYSIKTKFDLSIFPPIRAYKTNNSFKKYTFRLIVTTKKRDFYFLRILNTVARFFGPRGAEFSCFSFAVCSRVSKCQTSTLPVARISRSFDFLFSLSLPPIVLLGVRRLFNGEEPSPEKAKYFFKNAPKWRARIFSREREKGEKRVQISRVHVELLFCE